MKTGAGKKTIGFILVFICSLFLSGCVKVDMEFTIKKDGKVDATIIFAVNESMGALTDENMADAGMEDFEKMKEEGWDVKPYSAGGFAGYEMSI